VLPKAFGAFIVLFPEDITMEPMRPGVAPNGQPKKEATYEELGELVRGHNLAASKSSLFNELKDKLKASSLEIDVDHIHNRLVIPIDRNRNTLLKLMKKDAEKDPLKARSYAKLGLRFIVGTTATKHPDSWKVYDGWHQSTDINPKTKQGFDKFVDLIMLKQGIRSREQAVASAKTLIQDKEANDPMFFVRQHPKSWVVEVSDVPTVDEGALAAPSKRSDLIATMKRKLETAKIAYVERQGRLVVPISKNLDTLLERANKASETQAVARTFHAGQTLASVAEFTCHGHASEQLVVSPVMCRTARNAKASAYANSWLIEARERPSSVLE